MYQRGARTDPAEEFGLRAKKDRPYFVSNYGEPYPGMNTRSKDDPMRRYETFFGVQKPPPLKYPDLKEMVKVNVTYTDLPFQVRQDYFKLNEAQMLAPLTIQFRNKDLTWKAATGGPLHTGGRLWHGDRSDQSRRARV